MIGLGLGLSLAKIWPSTEISPFDKRAYFEERLFVVTQVLAVRTVSVREGVIINIQKNWKKSLIGEGGVGGWGVKKANKFPISI